MAQNRLNCGIGPKLVLMFLLSIFATVASAAGDQEIRFARDVQPLLSDNCFQCHGPDDAARKAGLRLDLAEAVFRERNGMTAVTPGKPEESELFLRITAEDPDEIMPPGETGKKLSEREVAVLRRWIEQGAVWEEHWAFVAPVKAPLPPPVSFSETAGTSGKDGTGRRHPVDAFVQAGLARENMTPSREANRRTLIRRLSFDLTGLPPAPGAVDYFVNDPAPDAYERLVERLLASPHYGERMAMMWMDAARYADTDGYQGQFVRVSSP